MDFLKLVQQKEQKPDNKIMVIIVLLVIFIIGLVAMWPKNNTQIKALDYLPSDTYFYYYWTKADFFTEDLLSDYSFFDKSVPQEKITKVESILGSNFLNAQELVWFRNDLSGVADNYLVVLYRLPKSLVDDLAKQYPEYYFYNPDNNVLLISNSVVENFENKGLKRVDFNDGLSLYWQVNKYPEFLRTVADLLKPFLQTDEVFINWQNISQDKIRLSFSQKSQINYSTWTEDTLVPKDFSLLANFSENTPVNLNTMIKDNFLKPVFNSLPYNNLNEQIIQDRILHNAIIFQKDDGWLLISEQDWQIDLLNFVNQISVEEVSQVLPDGTAYIELIASSTKDEQEFKLAGQTYWQLGNLFIVNLANRYYLSNKEKIIRKLITNNIFLKDIWQDCLSDKSLKVGDFIDIHFAKIADGMIKDYFLQNNINNLQVLSYSTSSISTLEFCF